MLERFQKQIHAGDFPAFSGYRKFRLKETDLNEVMRSIEGLLPRYIHGNIGTEVVLSDTSVKIMADIDLLGEALMHLVENAMDAMPDGGIFSFNANTVNLENGSTPLRSHANFGACALISLADTGIGIDEQIQERIFEPFFTTKTGNGKGLGLPIACHIIKEHGGGMKLESRVGQGTEVEVYLPLLKQVTANVVSMPVGELHGKTHYAGYRIQGRCDPPAVLWPARLCGRQSVNARSPSRSYSL